MNWTLWTKAVKNFCLLISITILKYSFNSYRLQEMMYSLLGCIQLSIEFLDYLRISKIRYQIISKQQDSSKQLLINKLLEILVKKLLLYLSSSNKIFLRVRGNNSKNSNKLYLSSSATTTDIKISICIDLCEDFLLTIWMLHSWTYRQIRELIQS